jgi:DUF4097 and DUF4098 domain-containing protein YvlB
MTRRMTAPAALLLTLVLAAPALAQRNRDRDWDDDRDQGPKETETVDRTLTVQPGGTLILKTFSGRVDIKAGSGNQVVVHAVRRATRSRLNDIKLEITQSGNTVTIDANHQLVERRNNNVVETDFDISVPADMRLDVKTFSADVTVTGVRGSHQIDGFSSEVRLVRVAGPMKVKTFSANVELQADAWNNGDDLDLNTFSGDIILRLPSNASGTINFDSFSGNFNSELPVTLQTSSKRNFRGDLNGGGNTDFKLKTFSGNVTIRK